MKKEKEETDVEISQGSIPETIAHYPHDHQQQHRPQQIARLSAEIRDLFEMLNQTHRKRRN